MQHVLVIVGQAVELPGLSAGAIWEVKIHLKSLWYEMQEFKENVYFPLVFSMVFL